MAEKKVQDDPTIEELKAEVESLRKTLEDAKAVAPEIFSEDVAEGLLNAEAVRERVQEGLEDVQKQVEAHPVPSALLAFGLGFLIGRLLTR
ncbi:MAG: hypothetical protein K9G30_01905 [Parvibaculum sp.]|nr:hypothetical protein [Parvibaculum sp.]